MKPNIWKAIAGGFIGTVMLTLMMRLVAPMMGVKMDIVGKLGDMTHTGMAGGLFIHFLNGTVIFPLIYVYLLAENHAPQQPFLPRRTGQPRLDWRQ